MSDLNLKVSRDTEQEDDPNFRSGQIFRARFEIFSDGEPLQVVARMAAHHHQEVQLVERLELPWQDQRRVDV